VLLADRLAPVGVLEVSHHGSGDATLDRLLARLRPRLAVISVGAHNRYGHPSPATLAALAKAHVPVRRTDLEGDIALTCPAG
jgi:competence protein ComEC